MSKWSTSLPVLFIPEEEVPGTHPVGHWVDPIAGLDAVNKKVGIELLFLRRPYSSLVAISTGL
jgi:hypothetical protein